MLLLHLVAWGVVLAVGIAFVSANRRDGMKISTSLGIRKTSAIFYGWPICCLEYRRWSVANTKTPLTVSPVPLICNVVVGLLIVAAAIVVFVLPLWRRKPFQIKLGSLFILTATVAIFCNLFRAPISIRQFVFFDPPPYFLISPPSFFTFPLYLQIPLGIGIGCAIYMGIWVVLRLVTALVRILVKRQPVAQSE